MDLLHNLHCQPLHNNHSAVGLLLFRFGWWLVLSVQRITAVHTYRPAPRQTRCCLHQCWRRCTHCLCLFLEFATLIREGSFYINNWIFTVGWGAVFVYATDADSDHRLGTIPAASAVSLPRLLPRPALINQSIVQERRDMKITSF